MRKTLLAAAVVSTLASTAAMAQVSGNLTIASDYRFRGVSQTFMLPTIQGGIDYAHASGFYAGNWNSNVSSAQYANGGGIEMDFYAGYKMALGDVGLDVGTLYYYYPGAEYTGTKEKYDNHEIYLGASYGPFSAKVSYALTDYFGANANTVAITTLAGPVESGDSDGTTYLELNYAQEVAPGLTLSAHLGATQFETYKSLDYTDYKVGVTYGLSGWNLGLAYVGTSMDQEGKDFNTLTLNGNREELYDGGLVLSVAKSF
jgi:uncharacterized protein (TIGR02001 family)